MNLRDDDLWSTIKELTKTHPNDQGIRMIADLARWVEEQCRLCATAAIPTSE